LISETRRLPDSNLKRSALSTLFARYVELAPERAAQQIAHMPGTYSRDITFVVFHYWARMDLNQAIAAVTQQPDRQLRQWGAEAIYYAWQHGDEALLTDIELRLATVADVGHLRMELQMEQFSGSPREMLVQALNTSDEAGKWQYIQQAAQQWAGSDPHEAYEYARNVPDQSQRQFILQTVLSVWAETESGVIEALETLAKNPNRSIQAMHISTVMRSLANRHPQKALEIIDTLPASTQRNAYQAVFQGWASTDVRAAMAALEQLPQDNFKRDAGFSVLYQFAAQYPLEALQWGIENSTDDRRSENLSIILPQVARSHPDEAMAMLQTIGNGNQRLIAMVVPAIANNDPAKAAELVEQLPTGQSQRMAITQLAQQWIQQDPDAALEWITRQSEQNQISALRQAGHQLAYQNPDKAIEIMGQLPATVRNSWTPAIAAAKAQNNPQEAAQWIQEFRGQRNYPQLLQQVSASWAQQDPVAALEFAQSQPEEDGRMAVQSTVMSWASRDPESAAHWISSQNDQKQLASSTRNVAAHWAQQDPQAARQWARSLRSPQARDNAISGVVSSGSLSTDNAIELIGSINGKRARSTAITGLFSRQYIFNREAALTLKDHPSLTDDDRRHIEMLQKSMDENPTPGVFSGVRF
ncbi:MAG: hypothetical protein OIF34_07565, partial [Porticoccaceae bacterium]|nr:hypothetical protein [Porticoccaceae bacterium]